MSGKRHDIKEDIKECAALAGWAMVTQPVKQSRPSAEALGSRSGPGLAA